MFQFDSNPRQGIVPWAQTSSALKTKGNDGWLSLELEQQRYPDELPSEDQAFHRSAAFLRNLLS
jgi:sugar phosphate isomerase/epimerase